MCCILVTGTVLAFIFMPVFCPLQEDDIFLWKTERRLLDSDHDEQDGKRRRRQIQIDCMDYIIDYR